MDAAQSTQGLQCATGASYARRRPESTLLYQIVERHYPKFLETLGASGRSLPRHVQREFEDYLKCGRLEHGFLRVRCEACHAEKLVAFSCKRRGFCPSCGARRMVESAALLIDQVLPEVPMRQCVLSAPFALRYLFSREPAAMGIALNLNVHFHMLMPDGVYLGAGARPEFVRGAASWCAPRTAATLSSSRSPRRTRSRGYSVTRSRTEWRSAGANARRPSRCRRSERAARVMAGNGWRRRTVFRCTRA